MACREFVIYTFKCTLLSEDIYQYHSLKRAAIIESVSTVPFSCLCLQNHTYIHIHVQTDRRTDRQKDTLTDRYTKTYQECIYVVSLTFQETLVILIKLNIEITSTTLVGSCRYYTASFVILLSIKSQNGVDRTSSASSEGHVTRHN